MEFWAFLTDALEPNVIWFHYPDLWGQVIPATTGHPPPTQPENNGVKCLKMYSYF